MDPEFDLQWNIPIVSTEPQASTSAAATQSVPSAYVSAILYRHALLSASNVHQIRTEWIFQLHSDPRTARDALTNAVLDVWPRLNTTWSGYFCTSLVRTLV